MVASVTSIVCPHCKQEIPLDEVLTHRIREELEGQFAETLRTREGELKAKEGRVIARERELAEAGARQQEELEGLKAALRKEYEGKVAASRKDFEKELREARKHIEEEERGRARDELSEELKNLRGELDEKSKEVKQLKGFELELRREKKKLEEERENLELEVTRRLDDARKAVQEEAVRRAEEQHRLKDREKESLIEALKGQIEELKRKAEQGSQQLQGEVLELELEEILRSSFPQDVIEAVPKGMRGADVIQRVAGPLGRLSGTIIWESKRTKAWNDGWIAKLKEDQREAKADMAALVSTVLPKGVSGIARVEGVWLADYTLAVGLAAALRYGLTEVAAARMSAEGRSEKMEMLYDYLAGPEFRQQIEGIVEAFVTMKKDLDAERRSMERVWARREKQIEKVVKNTGRMYGSLQGIIGGSLPELKALEMKAIAEEGE